jgi:hypothetical protein
MEYKLPLEEFAIWLLNFEQIDLLRSVYINFNPVYIDRHLITKNKTRFYYLDVKYRALEKITTLRKYTFNF